jgi:hypothetical protein
MSITMYPGAIFINAKILGDVFMIQLKTGIYEEARKVRTDQRNKQTYGNCFFEHLRKGNGYNK